MHYLEQLRAEVNETHNGLGNTVAFGALCVRANRVLVIIAPQGTGKSTVISALASVFPDSIRIPEVTRAGLESMHDQITGSSAMVYMDDLGAADTAYTRMSTLLTMAELCYAHTIGKLTAKSAYTIDDFFGSFVTSIQPVLIRPVIQTTQWESNLQDKIVRYYHLVRPVRPTRKAPAVTRANDAHLKSVSDFDAFSELPDRILDVADVQWGTARSQEHISAMLRGCASLDGRDYVDPTDIAILQELMAPMSLEKWAIRRPGIEEKREVDLALIYLMTEWATYGDFTLGQLMHDHKLIQSVAYKVMEKTKKLWTLSRKSPTTYAPSDRPLWVGEQTSMLSILEDCGVRFYLNKPESEGA